MLSKAAEERLFEQVNRRESGAFFYGVTTMGIYCRPDCPSPRPLRCHIRFFDSPADAEAKGFRACKRCDPKGERARIAEAVVRDACARIEAEETIPSLETLARHAGYSRFHFLRLFRAHTGLTPRAYADGVRARRLQAALSEGTRVADAIVGAGYGSESRVYEKTGALLGMTPGALRRGGAGETIRTTVADCPFGRMLVGATETGVCFLGFGAPDEALLGALKRRFPQAALAADDQALAQVVRAVLGFIEEPKQALALPLDLRGTAFQSRVWRALCRIPPGQTLSYAELAAMIEAPRAIRAVARACAANPVALAVPCHRVLGADGALRGYRWGVPRKRMLLERERQAVRCRKAPPNER